MNFFDDMNGEKWKEFLESIKIRGVIEPIVTTPEKSLSRASTHTLL